MPLYYGCVSRGPVILVDKSIGPGNYQAYARTILEDLPTTGNRKTTLPNDNVLYHTVTNGGLVYLCAADKDMGRRVPYLFLEDIEKQFSSIGSLLQRSAGASQFEFNRDFRTILTNALDDFNSGKGDQLSTMQKQVGEVTGIMKDNIEKVLDRGDKLDDLMDKSDNLQAEARTFQTTSRRINRKMFWKNKKMIIIIVIVSVILLTLIILFATGTI